MMQRGFWGLCGLALVGCARAGSIVVDDVKVTALSPTLLRIEPKVTPPHTHPHTHNHHHNRAITHTR